MAPFRLPPSARRWLADVLGCPADRLRMKRLAGATSSTLYEVRLAGMTSRFVLRCLTHREWLAEEPDILERESAALTVLAGSQVPAPRLAATDPLGEYCGAPALLMSALPGRVQLTPRTIDEWYRELAKPLPILHELPATGIRWHYHPYVKPKQAVVPCWTDRPDLWERAIELARQPWPEYAPAFIHRDYHPVNVLFTGSRLTGVVDWPNACLGPAAFDIAWCRLNLAFMFGGTAAADFLRACRETGGSHFTYNPFWDMLALIEVLPGPPQYYPPWAQFGLPVSPSAELISRVDGYLGSVLALFES